MTEVDLKDKNKYVLPVGKSQSHFMHLTPVLGVSALN